MKRTVERAAVRAAAIIWCLVFLGSRPGFVYLTGLTSLSFPLKESASLASAGEAVRGWCEQPRMY